MVMNAATSNSRKKNNPLKGSSETHSSVNNKEPKYITMPKNVIVN